jgi:hypothetical protein
MLPACALAGETSDTSAPAASLFDRTAESSRDTAAPPERTRLFTSNASTTGAGTTELVFSWNYWRSRKFNDEDGKSYLRPLVREHSLDLGVNYGITESLDVAAATAFFWIRDDWNDYDGDGYAGPTRGENIGDLSVWSKYRFFESADRSWALAYVGGFTVPTGTDSTARHIGTSQEYWSLENTLVATKDSGPWSTSANLGYMLPLGSERGDSRGLLNADIATGRQFLGWITPEVELNYAREFLASWPDAEVLSATTGAIFALDRRTRLSVGVTKDIWARNWEMGFGLLVGLRLAF